MRSVKNDSMVTSKQTDTLTKGKRKANLIFKLKGDYEEKDKEVVSFR